MTKKLPILLCMMILVPCAQAINQPESEWLPEWFGVPVRKIKIDEQSVKTVAYSIVGTFIACYGVALLYNSCNRTAGKLAAPENAELAWRQILSWHDYCSILAGIGTVGCGLGLIAKSDLLAR